MLAAVKILKCTVCADLVPFGSEDRACSCGACTGRYVTGRRVVYRGPAEVWGVKGLDFYSGQDWRDKMFPIAADSPWVTKEPAEPNSRPDE